MDLLLKLGKSPFTFGVILPHFEFPLSYRDYEAAPLRSRTDAFRQCRRESLFSIAGYGRLFTRNSRSSWLFADCRC